MIAVTGPTGFLGTSLCQTWVRDGRAVRAVGRRGAHRIPHGVEQRVVPSFTEPGALEDALTGCAAVVHLLGKAHDRGEDARSQEALWEANVRLTQRVVEAAAAVGIRHFVHLSTISVTGRSGLLTEATPCAASGSYGETKWHGEQAVLRAAAATGIRPVILRPPAIYGPGMKGHPWLLFRLVASGLPLPFGGLHGPQSMLYVGNLAAAIGQVLDDPRGRTGVYLLGDGEDLSLAGWVAAIAAALGRAPRLYAVPPRLLRGCCRVLDALASPGVAGLRGEGRLSRLLARLEESLVVDGSRFRADFNFSAPFTVEQALARTAEWFLARGRGNR